MTSSTLTLPPGTPHEFLGTAHVITLLIIVGVSITIPWLLRRHASEILIRRVALTFAVLLVVHKLAEIWVKMALFGGPVYLHLPLHLCGISVFLTAIVLWKRSFKVYELIFFWGLGGAVQALLTPDIPYGYPHPIYINFFVSHGAIILGVSFATVVYRLRPTWASVGRAFLATNLLALLLGLFNRLVGTNYMFLCHKPQQPSILDYFGPWPWYIVVLEGVALLLFSLIYLPFAIRDRFAPPKVQVQA